MQNAPVKVKPQGMGRGVTHGDRHVYPANGWGIRLDLINDLMAILSYFI